MKLDSTPQTPHNQARISWPTIAPWAMQKGFWRDGMRRKCDLAAISLRSASEMWHPLFAEGMQETQNQRKQEEQL